MKTRQKAQWDPCYPPLPWGHAAQSRPVVLCAGDAGQASSILQFIHGLRGELHVTWEEGTWASWLYDLLQPQVQQVLVCNPRWVSRSSSRRSSN